MLIRSEHKYETLLVVVAWFLAIVGVYTAISTFGQLAIMVAFYSTDTQSLSIAATTAVEMLFGVSATICGVGMLNRRSYALNHTIFLLWLYVLWLASLAVWTTVMTVLESNGADIGSPELAEAYAKLNRFTTASVVYGNLVSVCVCIGCSWVVRKLSLPLVKKIYAT